MIALKLLIDCGLGDGKGGFSSGTQTTVTLEKKSYDGLVTAIGVFRWRKSTRENALF